MNILKIKSSKKYLGFLLFLIIILNFGFFTSSLYSAFKHNESLPDALQQEGSIEILLDEKTCEYSKYSLSREISKLRTDPNNKKIEINFYEHPSILKCHDRPVITSTTLNVSEINKVEDIYIGIGVNTDIENLEKVGRFLLVFSIVALFYSNFKISTRKIEYNTKDFISMITVLTFYSFFVHTSLINAATNFLIFIIFGNIAFLFLTSFFDEIVIFKTIASLSIFPLMFNDSNISFFWLLLLFTFSLKRQNSIKLSKYIYFLFAAVLLPFVLNFNYYKFSKPNYYFDWILFKSGRHQGGLVDVNNGLQSIAYSIDIFLIVFIFFIIVKKYSQIKNFIDIFYDSLIYGFLIWFSIYFISQINPFLNFSIFKFFGLNEHIDTINSYFPEIGMNWRGVTSSHELTGFWIAIVSSLIVFRYLNTKKIEYIFYFILSLVSLSFNTQRTALIIFMFLVIYLLFIKFKKLYFFKTLIISISFLTFIFIPFGVNRLIERVTNLDFETVEFNSFHRASIKITQARHSQYNLQTPLSNTISTFEEYGNFNTFYSEVFKINNQFVIDSIIFTSKVFGREMQWARFLHFNDHIDNQPIFGKGPGQSYQFLDILIEKPHSLYLSMYYQYGYFGILILIFLLFHAIKRLLNTKNFIYLLLIMFFVNGIKSEFIFTHNQIVFFILFTNTAFLAYKNQK